MWNGCALYSQFSLDLTLWRYLPWYKFEDLIKTSSLFFTRADHLTREFDDAEGVMTASEKELIDLTLDAMHGYLTSQTTPVVRVSGIAFQGARSIDVLAYRDNVTKVYGYYLNHVHVNCWHHNSSEDVLMWKRYVPDGDGVVVQTSSRALLDSFRETPEEVIASAVEYIDHGNEPLTSALWRGGGLYLVLLQMLIRKKLKFSTEREFRLLTCQLPVRELYGSLLRKDLPFENHSVSIGKRLRVNLTVLQPRIVLHPNATAELRERVTALLITTASGHGLRANSVSASAIPRGTF